MAPRLALQLADRTVIAMTCRQCGLLKNGDQFPRYMRSIRDRMHYRSRRCVACWWSRLERSPGRSRNMTFQTTGS